MTAPSSTDIALIGAGPIGLEMAVALKQAGTDYLHFDARQIGHTISWFAPQTRFFSSSERIAIAGVPLNTADQTTATREEYLAYLRQVVQQFDLQIRSFEPVIDLKPQDGRFLVRTEAHGRIIETLARRVILSTGGTARPRLINVPGEDLSHVSHYFHDPHEYFRRNVVIVGGKNSAIEAALRCYHAGANVTISYRRAAFSEKSIKYWLLPEITGYIKEGKIAVQFNSNVERIDAEFVTLCTGEQIPADAVLLLTGYEADMALFEKAGIALSQDRSVPQFDEATMETSVPGLYVIGTATGGTQDRYTVFMENCHIHVARVMASLQGRIEPAQAPVLEQPES